MINLKSYPSASFVQEKMKDGEVYATVTEGKYKGTVGKIARVKRHHYDRHDYFLEVGGQTMKFCGSVLKVSSDHEVALVFDSEYVKEFKDFNDRVIEVGKLILVLRPSTNSSLNEMVMGNVRKIDLTGVFVEPFAINGSFFAGSGGKYLKVTKTSCCLMIDTATQHSILLNKLAAVDPND